LKNCVAPPPLFGIAEFSDINSAMSDFCILM